MGYVLPWGQMSFWGATVITNGRAWAEHTIHKARYNAVTDAQHMCITWNSCISKSVERELNYNMRLSLIESSLWSIITILKRDKQEDRPMTGRKTHKNASHALAIDCTGLCCNRFISVCITSLNKRYTFSSKALKTSILCISRNLRSVRKISNMDKLHKSDLRLSGIAERHTNALIVYKFSPPYLSTAWEVSQLEINWRAMRILQIYQKKLKKANDRVQKAFNIENMVKALYLLDKYHLSVRTTKGAVNFDYREIISNPCFLLIAYSSLKRKKTGGIDKIPIENVTLGGILTLSIELRSDKYKPYPSRWINIPKTNGGVRPLGIAPARDKIVQQACYTLLDPVFAPNFSKLSHGFIKKRSCHSALMQMNKTWGTPVWFIDADIAKCFDRIHHEYLMIAINQRINNFYLSRLILKQLRAGYVHMANFSDSKLQNKLGTPQGSILSPLLCNIILNELDKFVVEKLMKIHDNTETQSKRLRERHETTLKAQQWGPNTAPEWSKITKEIKELTPNIAIKTIRQAVQPLRRRQLAEQFDHPYYKLNDKYRKLSYVRYADDFVLGFTGPKKSTAEIIVNIAAFLNLHLKMDLNKDKSSIKHHSDGVIFLGYKIYGDYNLKGANWNVEAGQRTGGTSLKFLAPVPKLIERFAERGFFQLARRGKNVKFVGRRVDKWLFLISDWEVLQRFKSVVRGISNYYSGVTNQGALNQLYHLFRRSALLTIAHRHKQKTAKWAENKFTKNIIIEHPKKKGKTILFEIPKSMPQRWNSQFINRMLVKPEGVPLPVTLTAITSASELHCAIPNCPNQAEEWHHIKHRKKYKGSAMDRTINSYTNKQLPVCKKHHNQITFGKYDGPSLRKLNGYTPSNFDS